MLIYKMALMKPMANGADKENITFRLDTSTLRRLRDDAEEKSASVNSIAQGIFATHYDWTSSASKAGMIPVHKMMLTMILDRLTQDDIKEIALLFADVRVKDMTLILKKDYSLTSFLEVLGMWMKQADITFQKNATREAFAYTISHEMGRKWSLFLSLVLKSVIEKMGVTQTTFETTDNVILFKMPIVELRAK